MGWNLLDALAVAYVLGGAVTLLWAIVFEGKELTNDCADEVGSHPVPPHAVKAAVGIAMTMLYVGIWLAWPLVAGDELRKSTARGWKRLRQR